MFTKCNVRGRTDCYSAVRVQGDSCGGLGNLLLYDSLLTCTETGTTHRNLNHVDLVRHPSTTGVSAVVCDALDLKGVEAVLDGCDAAITTLGGSPDGDETKRVDYAGNRNVIESAGILGITRVVMVTSVGCGSSREAISDKVYEVSCVIRLHMVDPESLR